MGYYHLSSYNSSVDNQLGRLGDSLGRSKIYNSGFVVFTVGSALVGTSFNIDELIGFRALQAFGGAMCRLIVAP